MSPPRTVLLPCACGKIHRVNDPGRNLRLRCRATGTPLAYECHHPAGYRLRGEDKDIPIEFERAVVGRLPKSGIFLNRPGISRQHCRLEVTEEGCFVEDLGSSNGTFLNEERLEPNARSALQPGDLLRLADTRFRFVGPEPTHDDPANPTLQIGTEAERQLAVAEEPAAASDSTPIAPAPPGERDPLLGRQLGDFKLTAFMSQGGMGRVYRARQESTGRDCVVKTVVPELMDSEKTVDRFLREIELGARIAHPNIIEFIDSGREGNTLFLAMEYFAGRDLGALYRRTPAPVKLALGIGRQLASALAAAHDRGIIHRDLKPENVLQNSRAEIKLLDFGIAKACQDEDCAGLTMSGMVVGTPQYMAPEQLSDSRGVGPSADIFALGAVIYFCLTSHPPHAGKNLGEIFRAMKKGDIPSIRKLRPEVPASLAATVTKALSKDPTKRFPSAKAFKLALDQIKLKPA